MSTTELRTGLLAKHLDLLRAIAWRFALLVRPLT